MKKNKVYVLLPFIILMAVVGTIFFYYSYNIYDVKIIGMSIISYDHYGFSVDTDHLEFGMNTPGGGSNTRSINLIHNYKGPLLVVIKVEGEMAGWVNFENNFVLEPGVNKKVDIDVSIPSSVGYGNYTGDLIVIFKKNF